jgi:hypothetical protein
MNRSRLIVAHFTGQSVTLSGQGGMVSSNGFQFNVSGDPQAVYQIFTSSDLINWQSAGFVTNTNGITSFIDPTATNAPKRFYDAVLTQ